MIINEQDLIDANEKKLMLQGAVGQLEAVFNGNQNNQMSKTLAVIGHPHSLHGGTMNNKVVTTLARTFRDQGIANLRFNFRGVGESEGEFDKGIGESEDLLKIISELKAQFPDHQLILAGFSFGAYVTYRAACQSNVALLISVAPAVNHGDFLAFDNIPQPWHVMVAGSDEIVPQSDILAWHKQVTPSPELHLFEDCSHFFHGKLVLLRDKLKLILENF